MIQSGRPNWLAADFYLFDTGRADVYNHMEEKDKLEFEKQYVI